MLRTRIVRVAKQRRINLVDVFREVVIVGQLSLAKIVLSDKTEMKKMPFFDKTEMNNPPFLDKTETNKPLFPYSLKNPLLFFVHIQLFFVILPPVSKHIKSNLTSNK